MNILQEIRIKLIEIANDQPINLAISGGSTLAPLFDYLRDNPLSRDINFNVYWVDERMVPYTDARNNAKVAIDKWLMYESNATVYRIATDIAVDQSIEQYSAVIPLSFDYVIMGMGLDGHVASIFPKNKPRVEPLFHVFNNLDQTYRISLNYSVLSKAKAILLLVNSEEKRGVLEQGDGLPVHILMKAGNVSVVYV